MPIKVLSALPLTAFNGFYRLVLLNFRQIATLRFKNGAARIWNGLKWYLLYLWPSVFFRHELIVSLTATKCCWFKVKLPTAIQGSLLKGSLVLLLSDSFLHDNLSSIQSAAFVCKVISRWNHKPCFLQHCSHPCWMGSNNYWAMALSTKK